MECIYLDILPKKKYNNNINLRKQGDIMESAKKIRETEYTVQDIYNLPDGQRAELIDGQIYMMAPPKRSHQLLSWKLHQTIGNYIDLKNGNCEVYAAPFAVFLNADDKTYVEPDISVICDKDKLNDDGCSGAPDWIIEIVSKGSLSHDYIRKLNLYLNAGVREYWIVDYQRNKITVWNFENDIMLEYTFQDKVKAGIYQDFEIDFSKFDIE